MSRVVVTDRENLSTNINYRCAITAPHALNTGRMRDQVDAGDWIRPEFLFAWGVTAFQGGAVTVFHFRMQQAAAAVDVRNFIKACSTGAGATASAVELTRPTTALEDLGGTPAQSASSGGGGGGGSGLSLPSLSLPDLPNPLQNVSDTTRNVAIIAAIALVGYVLVTTGVLK